MTIKSSYRDVQTELFKTQLQLQALTKEAEVKDALVVTLNLAIKIRDIELLEKAGIIKALSGCLDRALDDLPTPKAIKLLL
jgi:hypothetical protein|tara:strand:- start:1981 stop:2223 length:243 start_codon:yes stop_codon:yes gene_type:complete